MGTLNQGRNRIPTETKKADLKKIYICVSLQRQNYDSEIKSTRKIFDSQVSAMMTRWFHLGFKAKMSPCSRSLQLTEGRSEPEQCLPRKLMQDKEKTKDYYQQHFCHLIYTSCLSLYLLVMELEAAFPGWSHE
jgi:hypothetical protein